MPELPEVETVVRGLRADLEGAKLGLIEVRNPKLRYHLTPDFADVLSGRIVISIERRAKYIIVRLDDGTVWLSHLGMSGRFHTKDCADEPQNFAKHDHIVIEVLGRSRHYNLIYHDPRRFGFMRHYKKNALEECDFWRKIGREPLDHDFGPETFFALLSQKSTKVRHFLLDQSLICGLGNIYVAEALFLAKIHPNRPANDLTQPEAKALLGAIKQTLLRAIEAGGSSIRDFKQTTGATGYFQHDFYVYGRAHDPCRREGCKGIIIREKDGGRSSYFCTHCQN